MDADGNALIAEARHRAVLRWLRNAGPSTVVLCCADGPSLGVPGLPLLRWDGCLTTMPDAWLLELAVAAQVQVVVDGCPEETDLRRRIDGLATLTASRIAAGHALSQRPGDEISYAQPPANRRGLIGLGTPAAPTGDPHQRLLAAVQALNPQPEAAAAVPGPAATLVVQGCTGCGVCVRSCPHQALTLVHDDGHSRLSHAADACQATGLCAAVCPERAITLAGRLSWAEVLDARTTLVADVETTQCARCQAWFPASEATLCPVCATKVAAPFSSYLPPVAEALLRRRRAVGNQNPGNR